MFAKRMKQAMVDQGISQAKLSDMTGIGRSGISQYLSGKNKPGQKHLSIIADALNVAESWLTGEIEEQTAIGQYTNLPIAIAAKLMSKSKQFVRIGLQQQKLPFGYAVKIGGNRFTYYISPKKFTEYTGIGVNDGT